MTALELIAAFLVTIGLTLFVMALAAPEGWQDADGFHFGARGDGTVSHGDTSTPEARHDHA